jgi:hypothetical protein
VSTPLIQLSSGDLQLSVDGQIALFSFQGGGIVLHNYAGTGTGNIQITQATTGGINMQDTGGGGIQLTSGGFTLNVNDGAGHFVITGLPTSNPGGSHRVWNNGGVLSIT